MMRLWGLLATIKVSDFILSKHGSDLHFLKDHLGYFKRAEGKKWKP